jgi:gas vesicle protein
MMNLKNLKNLDRDDVLSMLGLETKSSTAGWLTGTLGTFGVGLLVGAALGLMLAPKPGRELRGDIRNRLRHAPEDLGEKVQGLTGRDPHASVAATNNKSA